LAPTHQRSTRTASASCWRFAGNRIGKRAVRAAVPFGAAAAVAGWPADLGWSLDQEPSPRRGSAHAPRHDNVREGRCPADGCTCVSAPPSLASVFADSGVPRRGNAGGWPRPVRCLTHVKGFWTDLAASLTNEDAGHASSASATPTVCRISDMLTRRSSHLCTLRLDHHAALHSASKNGHPWRCRNGTAEAKPVPQREGALGA
jgi:hypothetical protein